MPTSQVSHGSPSVRLSPPYPAQLTQSDPRSLSSLFLRQPRPRNRPSRMHGQAHHAPSQGSLNPCSHPQSLTSIVRFRCTSPTTANVECHHTSGRCSGHTASRPPYHPKRPGFASESPSESNTIDPFLPTPAGAVRPGFVHFALHVPLHLCGIKCNHHHIHSASTSTFPFS